MSQIILDKIIQEIRANGGIILGTECLTLKCTTIGSKIWVKQQARILAERGEIVIIPSRGGRGRKTAYKLNRNSPGQARRKR